MTASNSSPEQHELQTNVQTMIARVLSVDRRSAAWDAELSGLQDLDIQLTAGHWGRAADAWQMLAEVQMHLAQVSADFAEYVRQRETRQREARQREARQSEARQQHAQQQLHQALQQRQHESQQVDLGRRQQHADVLGRAPLLGALQLQQPRHHQQHAGDLRLESIISLAAPLVGALLQTPQQHQQHHADPGMAALSGVMQLFGHVLREL